MIAFSREAVATDGSSPRPILIISPPVVMLQASDDFGQVSLDTGVAEMVAAEIEREQQNLAMLQRALLILRQEMPLDGPR